jgi:ribonuclease HI
LQIEGIIMIKREITLYTDGACSGNPGIGGWACVLIYKQYKKELSGAEENTTNNRMELKAIIEGLKAIKDESAIVNVYSDSAYSVNAINEGWVYGWMMNGWRTSGKDDVKNVDLWKELIALTKRHDVTFIKVKGHADNELNNRCDALARGAIKELQKQIALDTLPF